MNCSVSRYSRNNLERTAYHFTCAAITTVDGPVVVRLSAVTTYCRRKQTDSFKYIRTWTAGVSKRQYPSIPKTVPDAALEAMRSQLVLDSKVHA
jgi:hypothetical protein